MSWILRNWHLKLGALALATILYTGFVYSGSFTEQTFPGVPVSGLNQPDDSFPLTQELGSVDIRYRLSADASARVTADSFAVSVDLAAYDMDQAPEPQSLPVRVRSLVDGLEVLSYSPTAVTVEIDRLGSKEVPVVVDRGEVPEGLEIGTPRVSSRSVIATGPESILGRVDRAMAQVQVFASGIDVERQVTLVPVDVDGRRVGSVELDPATVEVQIDVRTVEASKTVPVRPTVTGSPAQGFEVASVSVEPAVVTLLGPPDALADVVELPISGIDVSGAQAAVTRAGEYVLPAGTRVAADTPDPTVTIEVRAAVATRTLLVGVNCTGAPTGTTCLPQQSQIAVTLRGPATTLAALDPTDLGASVDAAGQSAGTHSLPVTFTIPDGVEVVGANPASVTVVIQPAASPTPAT